MECFRLEHPADRLILCDHSDCEEIADYLELQEGGREDLFCAAHTSSQKHVSVLPSRSAVAPKGASSAQGKTVIEDPGLRRDL